MMFFYSKTGVSNMDSVNNIYLACVNLEHLTFVIFFAEIAGLIFKNSLRLCITDLKSFTCDFRSKKGISVVDSSKAGMRFRNQDLEGMNKEYR